MTGTASDRAIHCLEQDIGEVTFDQAKWRRAHGQRPPPRAIQALRQMRHRGKVQAQDRAGLGKIRVHEDDGPVFGFGADIAPLAVAAVVEGADMETALPGLAHLAFEGSSILRADPAPDLQHVDMRIGVEHRSRKANCGIAVAPLHRRQEGRKCRQDCLVGVQFLAKFRRDLGGFVAELELGVFDRSVAGHVDGEQGHRDPADEGNDVETTGTEGGSGHG